MEEEPLIINLILRGEDKEMFLDLKSKIGIQKPNTEILRLCMKEVQTKNW